MSNIPQKKEEETIVFLGKHFKLLPLPHSHKKFLKLGKVEKPTFKFLFKMFNPYVQEIYEMKSRHSENRFAIGKCTYFHSYYYISGKQKLVFEDRTEAVRYLTKFKKPIIL